MRQDAKWEYVEQFEHPDDNDIYMLRPTEKYQQELMKISAEQWASTTTIQPPARPTEIYAPPRKAANETPAAQTQKMTSPKLRLSLTKP